MMRALEHAARGIGGVEPNPPVGAVIVAPDGRELAVGWHRQFGGPHAEPDALAGAAQRGIDVRGATMYVTLEPCAAFPGKKTPPCCQALAAAGIARVVVAMADPDPNVAGRGISQLRQAGVEVAVGTCGPAAAELLAPYSKLRTRRRPWVIAKWAQTAEGYLALPPGQGRWISSESSRRRVHELRAICDAVAVGIGTVLADDPLLNNRSGAGRAPARVVLDANLRIPLTSRLLQTAASAGPLIVATTAQAVRSGAATAAAIRAAGAELLELPGENARIDLPALLDDFGRRSWTRLLIEGGAKLLAAVLGADLADELWAFVAPRKIGSVGMSLPRLDLADVLRQGHYRQTAQETLEGDELNVFRKEPQA